MYRFQFEALSKRLLALPCPPEMVAERLEKKAELEKKLAEAEDITKRLEDELAEEKKARLELQSQLDEERQLSWLKKLLRIFGIK